MKKAATSSRTLRKPLKAAENHPNFYLWASSPPFQRKEAYKSEYQLCGFAGISKKRGLRSISAEGKGSPVMLTSKSEVFLRSIRRFQGNSSASGRAAHSACQPQHLPRRILPKSLPSDLEAPMQLPMKSLLVRSLLLALLGATFFPIAAHGADPSLDIELVTEAGFRQEDARKWFALFEEINIYGVKIRGGKRGDRVAFEALGEPPTRYRITGILSGSNQLDLPGGKFTVSDKARLAAWAAKVRSGGEDALFEKPVALGLTAKQLDAAKKEWAGTCRVTTKDQPPGEIVSRILREITPSITLDGKADAKLAQLDKFPDDLTGLSAGTMLAAVLRPAGLALVPIAEGRTVTWQIVDSQRAAEVWPVGWRPTKPPKDYVPELFKFLTVEIEDTPLTEVIEALQERLAVPVIIDQNSLARERVDLATTKVSLPKTNTFYQKILERALFQAKLKLELRVDEADKPFLWITTIRQ